MGICDICGKTRDTRLSNLEGANVDACFFCVPGKKEKTRFSGGFPGGKKNTARPDVKKRIELPKVNFEFVDDYGDIIKVAREKADITQKDFGAQLNEHSSVIQKIEHGGLKPRLGLAKKIEKKLKIRIIKKIEQLDKDGNVVNNKKPEESEKKYGDKSEVRRERSKPREALTYTLADAIKVRKKK
ncbi:MAG: helix-turn-helix domain-containing protein [DPANN group archaeon]|nr:helix-turn-helix domain-containing protein [DPANN group archaeon]